MFNKKLIKNNKKMMVFLIIFMILIYIRDARIFEIPNYIYVLFVFAMIPFLSKEQLIGLGICMCFFINAFQTNLILLGIIIVLVVKNLSEMHFNTRFLLLFMIGIWELFHFVYSPFSFEEYRRFIIIILFLAICDCLIIEDYRLILDMFLMIGAFAMFDILSQYFYYAGNNIMAIINYKYRFGNVAMINNEVINRVYDNENYIAYFCLLGVLAAMLIKRETAENKYIGFVAYFGFIGFLTRSKAFFICVGFIVIWIIITLFVSRITQTTKSHIISWTISMGAMLFFLVSKKNNIIEAINNVLTRFQTTNLTTGRSEVFADYFRFWTSNPLYMLFGIGTQSVDIKSSNIHTMHNVFQELFVCIGIIGVIIFVIYIYREYKSITNRSGRLDSYKIMSIVTALLFLSSIQYLRSPQIFITTLLIICILRYKLKRQDFTTIS